MASGAFQFIGGSANNIIVKITTTSATIIAGDPLYSIFVPWFACSEITGGTPNLTVEVYDGTTSYYMSTGGVTYIAKGMTGKQGVLFDQGYWLNAGQYIRVTSSVANQVDVTGVQSLPNTQGS